MRSLGARLASGGTGLVSSVFTRTGAVVAAANDYTWAQIDKATSSLADITTRAISDTTGTLAVARGGTGGTASTGTTNVGLSNSPTLVTPALGTPSSGTLTDCTGLPEGGLSLTDVTTANASSTAHGFVPKWPNNTTTFFRGDGTYAAPAGGGVWTEIAEASPTTGTNVEFATIATGYTEFILTGYYQTAISAGNGEFTMQLNNDATAGNYTHSRVGGGGIAPTSVNNTSDTKITMGDHDTTGDKGAKFWIWISNHATGENKHVLFQYGSTNFRIAYGNGRWINTANEISTIDLDISGTNATFVTGSRIWLLGRTN